MQLIPYLLILCIPMFFLFFGKKDNEEKNLLIIFFAYFLFAALRGNGSGDYFNYLNGVFPIDSFDKIFYIESYPFEIGFRVIAYINNLLRFTPQFTIVVLNAISLINIFFVIKKYSADKILSAFLYFSFLLVFDMHHTRSAVAISFVVQFVFSLISKNYPVSFLFSILALSFHNSSIFPLIIILISYVYLFEIKKREVNNNFYILFLVSLFVFSAFFSLTKIITFVITLMPPNIFFFKILRYLSDDTWSYPFSILDPRLILLFVTYFLSHLVSDLFSSQARIYKLMTFWALVIMLLFRDSTMLVMRLYNFFNVFTIFLLPEMSILYRKLLNENQYKIIFLSGIFVYMVYFIALSFRQVPYYFFF